MLLLAATWIVALVLFVTIGAAVVARIAMPAPERAVAAAWIGLGTVATVALGASLFMPVRPLVPVGAAGALAALSLARRATRDLLRELFASISWGAAGVFAVALVAAAAVAAQEPALYDTGLYHYPAVTWLSQLGAVRGAALFSTYLGYTSSWLALGAGVNGIAPYRMVGFGGGLALLIGSLHAALAAARALRGEARVADWFMVCASVIALPRFYGGIGIQSLSPDMPVLFLGLAVLWALLAGAPVLAVLLASFAVGAKLAALPLLAVAILAAGRRAPGAAVLAGVILAPWVAVTFVTTGCLAHPVPATCVDVPWGIGAADAAGIARIVLEWARWDGPTPPGATEVSWIVPWLTREVGRTIMLVVALGSSLWALARHRELRWAAAAVLAVIFMLLSRGPSPRFGLAAFAAAPAMLMAVHAVRRPWVIGVAVAYSAVLQITSIRLALGLAILAGLAVAAVAARRRFVVAALLLAVLDAVGLLGRAYQVGRFSLHPVVPAPIQRVVATHRDRAVNFEFRRPDAGDQCWGSPLPCAPWALRHTVGLRRPDLGLRGGFVRR